MNDVDVPVPKIEWRNQKVFIDNDMELFSRRSSSCLLGKGTTGMPLPDYVTYKDLRYNTNFTTL